MRENCLLLIFFFFPNRLLIQKNNSSPRVIFVAWMMYVYCCWAKRVLFQTVPMLIIKKARKKKLFGSSTGHENNIAQPKAGKCPSSASRFPPFSCCLSVVLLPDCEDYPENLHVVFCPNKQRSFEPLMDCMHACVCVSVILHILWRRGPWSYLQCMR